MTIPVIKVLVLAIVLGAMWLDSEFASAKVVRWDLQNVTFTDGATGRGFFLWDADTSPDKHLVSWDIAIEGGTPDPSGPAPGDYRFTPESSTFWFNGLLADPTHGFTLAGPILGYIGVHPILLELLIYSDSVLSDAGGTLGMGGFEWLHPHPGSGIRFVTTGQINAIPEASYALFLAVGLVTLVSLSARRKWL